MRLVKVNKIISVSSQDKHNPVENIVNNGTNSTSVSLKWLSSPTNKTQNMEAEVLLEEAVAIKCIELGNWGSSSIEILAKNTSWPSYMSYITLLPSATLRTWDDSKTGANFDIKKEFTEDQFGKEAVCKKFDQLKIICGQPYTEPFQYGLSFLHFKADDIRLHYSTEDFYSGQSIPSLFDRVMGNNPPMKTYLSRGRQMVDVALSQSSNSVNTIASSTVESPQNNNDEPFDYSLKVTLFLTDPCCTKKVAAVSVNELMRLFERKNQLMLIDSQKEEFHQIYSSLFSQANIFTESSKSPSSENFRTPVSSSLSSVSSSNRKRGKHVPCNSSRISNGDDRENLIDSSFDVDSTPKKKARSSQKNLFGSNNTSSSSGSQTVITLEDDDNDPSGSGSSYRPQDFIQSDGSVPSTSKATSFVDCPICAQEFHVGDIEKHAATCENFKSQAVDSDDDDDNSSALYNQTVYYTCRYGTKC